MPYRKIMYRNFPPQPDQLDICNNVYKNAHYIQKLLIIKYQNGKFRERNQPNEFEADSCLEDFCLGIMTPCFVSICNLKSSILGKMSEHVSQVNFLHCNALCSFI